MSINPDYTAAVSLFTACQWDEETATVRYVHQTPIMWCAWGMDGTVMEVWSPITGEFYTLEGEAMERMLLTLR